MFKYVVRRLLQMIPLLLLMSMLVFIIVKMAPGDPFAYMVGPDSDPAQIAKMKATLGLDRPWYVQYGNWLKETVSGNLGYSIRHQRPVAEMMAVRLGPTFLLAGTAFVIGMLLAIPFGVMASTRPYSIVDYTASTIAFMGISLPQFFTALLAIYIFGVVLRWTPLNGLATPDAPFSLLDRLHHLVLPAMTLAVREIAVTMRFTRSSMLEVLRQDYVRTARAKGLAERVVIYKHALRNSLIPVITLIGFSLPTLFSGGIVLEILFAWPGMGQFTYNALLDRDYPILMTTNLFFATLVMLGNLLADVLYAVADPRIRFS